jgi:hypothetical protein
MKRHKITLYLIGGISFLLFIWALPAEDSFGWSEHPLLSFPVLASMPKVRDAAPVKAETLASFVQAEQAKIERYLSEEEAWARKSVPSYPPLPDAIRFRADGDGKTVESFANAIRVNPRAGFPLYIAHVPGQAAEGPVLRPSGITFLKHTEDWEDTVFTAVEAGNAVKALDVVVSATDEPDLLGLDLGLFNDNGTPFGKASGFGKQPFGNPNLEYSSQAPFHMGFFHEAKIMYMLAGFLKRTYPEYRIHLYAGLSDLAFKTGHPYWGWRFLGWGLHYIADLTQPYHSTVLPGVSTARALWINTIDMAGFREGKANAIQLVSNRHTAIEKYQQLVLKKAYREKGGVNVVLAKLQSAGPAASYDPTVPRQVLAKQSHARAADTDRITSEAMPYRFVSDPAFELGTSSEKAQILERIIKEKGPGAVDKLNRLIADLLAPFAVYGPAYVNSVVR